MEAGSFVENLVVFGRLLRRVGFDVPVGRILDLTEALTHVDLDVRDEVFHTCRALLVQRHDQLTTFAEVFDAFWRDHGNPFAMQTATVRDARTAAARTSASAGVLPPEETASDEDEKSDAAPEGVLQTWSEIGGLAHKDFAEFSADEMARARFALDRLEWIPGERRTRRWIRGRGPRVDIRRALMRSLRTGGEVITLPHPSSSHQAAAARAALRCQRFDGALLAHAPALRAWPGRVVDASKCFSSLPG